MYKVTKLLPDGHQTIATCLSHMTLTMAELDTEFPKIEIADDATHTCMGCLKDWPRDYHPQ